MQEEEETPENEAAVAMGHTPTNGLSRPSPLLPSTSALWPPSVLSSLATTTPPASSSSSRRREKCAIVRTVIWWLRFGEVCEEPVQSATASAQNTAPSGWPNLSGLKSREELELPEILPGSCVNSSCGECEIYPQSQRLCFGADDPKEKESKSKAK
ncbi:hypothetical protein EV1_031448 [Malus domestica]